VSVDALGIPREWPSIDLPGYRDHPKAATYSVFEYDRLPPIERHLDDGLSWLLSQPAVEYSLAGGHIYEGEPVRSAVGAELDALTDAISLRLPPAFETFVRTREPRSRVRSCTACYLDLGDFTVAVGDRGWLIHFLSDQQWVRHWLLYVDRDGTEAVVSTYPPYGFSFADADEEPEWASDFDPLAADVFKAGASESVICAESFSEFLYRFWIENEIWYALGGSDESTHDLTPEQRRYSEHYLQNPEPRTPQAS
jgi:hypothetical protein